MGILLLLRRTVEGARILPRRAGTGRAVSTDLGPAPLEVRPLDRVAAAGPATSTAPPPPRGSGPRAPAARRGPPAAGGFGQRGPARRGGSARRSVRPPRPRPPRGSAARRATRYASRARRTARRCHPVGVGRADRRGVLGCDERLQEVGPRLALEVGTRPAARAGRSPRRSRRSATVHGPGRAAGPVGRRRRPGRPVASAGAA